jgi:ribosomal protein S6E (S10)
MIRVIIAIWNRNHIAFPALACGGPRKARSMLSNDPGYWHRRAEEARVMARQMSDEQNRKMMLKIADAYDGLAIKATTRSET